MSSVMVTDSVVHARSHDDGVAVLRGLDGGGDRLVRVRVIRIDDVRARAGKV